VGIGVRPITEVLGAMTSRVDSYSITK
jgi:hypothetical protein